MNCSGNGCIDVLNQIGGGGIGGCDQFSVSLVENHRQTFFEEAILLIFNIALQRQVPLFAGLL